MPHGAVDDVERLNPEPVRANRSVYPGLVPEGEGEHAAQGVTQSGPAPRKVHASSRVAWVRNGMPPSHETAAQVRVIVNLTVKRSLERLVKIGCRPPPGR